MRFHHPKSWASSDHLPGPISAKATANVLTKTQFQSNAEYVYASAAAVSASKVLATGVYPMMTSAPKRR